MVELALQTVMTCMANRETGAFCQVEWFDTADLNCGASFLD